MGYFTCVHCRCRYYDQRFAWEKDGKTHGVTSNPQSADESWQQPTVVDKARTRCDVVRMTGTVANWTGMALPTAAHYLSTVSAVGGLVGASCGAAQLHQGLSMPSGVKDPHLITKGGVTSAVGGTCMMLGAAASAWPALFYGAAGLGLVGLMTAVSIDRKVDGLCLACRGCLDTPTPESTPRSLGAWPTEDSKVVLEDCTDKGCPLLCPPVKKVSKTQKTGSSCWQGIGRLSNRLCQSL